MKTTVEIADDLFLSLKQEAKASGVSMKRAFNEAVRNWLERSKESSTQKVILEDVVFKGDMTEEAKKISWDEIREISSREHKSIQSP